MAGSDSDGLVLVGDKIVGKYFVRPFPENQIVVSVQDGLDVETLVRVSTAVGQKITLIPNDRVESRRPGW